MFIERDNRENGRLVTEALITRINTREASTLVFATVAMSASMVIFALVVQSNMPENLQWVKWIGLLFSVLGLIYREVTVLTSDRIDYEELDRRLIAPLPRPHWFWIIFRGATILFFLFIPIVAWWMLLTDTTCFLSTLTFVLITSVLLASSEFLLRKSKTKRT